MVKALVSYTNLFLCFDIFMDMKLTLEQNRLSFIVAWWCVHIFVSISLLEVTGS